ncbi:3-carboxy-cis,cis-muconate cycloisomerase, partial [Streptomyces sp. NPDC004011]
MTPPPSGRETPPQDDTGLLAPGWAGTPAAAATSDTAHLRALLDAETALT